jgi:hypothetical protein
LQKGLPPEIVVERHARPHFLVGDGWEKVFGQRHRLAEGQCKQRVEICWRDERELVAQRQHHLGRDLDACHDEMGAFAVHVSHDMTACNVPR